MTKKFEKQHRLKTEFSLEIKVALMKPFVKTTPSSVERGFIFFKILCCEAQELLEATQMHAQRTTVGSNEWTLMGSAIWKRCVVSGEPALTRYPVFHCICICYVQMQPTNDAIRIFKLFLRCPSNMTLFSSARTFYVEFSTSFCRGCRVKISQPQNMLYSILMESTMRRSNYVNAPPNESLWRHSRPETFFSLAFQ